ncbi:lipopolysaccharide heptosyltransferase II [bacterium]|nr:lipopolysaccharide heptosyltransferase II [bacterium]
MKIVVRAPNWMGDCILALPALQCLHKNRPQAQIWVAALPALKDLFTLFPFIQGVIPLSHPRSLRSYLRLSRNLQKHHFHSGLLFTNSFSSALLLYLSKTPQRWGYIRDGRGLLLTKGIKPPSQKDLSHQVYYYLNLLSGLGFQTKPPPELNLPLSSREKKEAFSLLNSQGVNFKKPLVVFHPGAHYGPSKRWPPSHFAELARRLQEKYQANILLLGSPQESPICDSISSSLNPSPLQLCGKTNLFQLAGILDRADVVVANDSGPMHMANALKTPLISLFGPTNPRLTGPFQPPSTVFHKNVSCWPCFYRKCPFDHRCMKKISPAEVFQACEKYL